MKKIAVRMFLAIIILPLINSCGNSKSNDAQMLERVPEASIDGSTIDGLYMAKFTTLNSHVNGTIPGSLTFYRKDDRLITYVRLFAGGPKVWHQQGVYLGDRCPNLNDDSNKDGFIDIVEAMAVIGKLIIPLDANMNTQSAGRNFYPLADLSGYYHYERISSFRRFFSDLKEPDLDTEDHIAKLLPTDKFTVEGKVVMVQGISEETLLPETVVGLARKRAFQTLPITCGIITKVSTLPGIPYDGMIPGSIADIIEGQDRPAGEGEGEDQGTSGGTVAGTTGTNDTNEGEVGDENTGTTSGGESDGSTTGASPSGSSTTGGSTNEGGTTGGSTGGSGGFIGGFIGGGGDSSGSSGGSSGGAEER